MVNKFRYYTQSIIVIMTIIRIMLMYWNFIECLRYSLSQDE